MEINNWCYLFRHVSSKEMWRPEMVNENGNPGHAYIGKGLENQV